MLDISEDLNIELEKLIKESGFKRTFIANLLGIELNSLRRKLKGERRWKDSEVEVIKEITSIAILKNNKNK